MIIPRMRTDRADSSPHKPHVMEVDRSLSATAADSVILDRYFYKQASDFMYKLTNFNTNLGDLDKA